MTAKASGPAALAVALAALASACGGGGGAASSADAGAATDAAAAGADAISDASRLADGAVPACSDVDAAIASGDPESDAGRPFTDELGPNAAAAKTASALGRVNVYEVTAPALLARVDVYLQANLAATRITIAVQEATSRTAAFRKLTDIQLDVGTCRGWATTGPLSIPLVPGRFYAIGFDPNQPVTPFVSADADSLPVDTAFGRLVGSKTATSVSVSMLTWDKLTEKEFNRQRLATSPRDPDPVADGGASTDGSGSAD